MSGYVGCHRERGLNPGPLGVNPALDDAHCLTATLVSPRGPSPYTSAVRTHHVTGEPQ